MKKPLAILLIVFFGMILTTCEEPGKEEEKEEEKEEKQTITFSKTYGGSDWDGGVSIQQTTDGGYIISGFTNSYGNGGQDAWLVKTDSVGGTLWTQTFGGSSTDASMSVQQTTDGGYVIVGYTDSFGNGYQDFYLTKTDSQGNEEWNKTIGGTEPEMGYSIQQTTDGGYIITGEKWSGEIDGYDFWLIKTDSQGDEEWNKTYGGSDWDNGRSVQQTTDGGYIIAGRTNSFGNGDYDFWLIKTDSNGNEEWNQTFGGSESDWGESVQQTTDGGYIITGITNSYGDGKGDVWLIKADSEGNKEWNQNFGGSERNKGESVQQTTDGGYIITGWTNSFGNGDYDFWLIKTDSNGNEEWNQTFGGSEGDQSYSVQQTIDGGYIITGSTHSSGSGGQDVLLIKTDSEGNTN